mmetsp:Transcript_2223/g.8174  ORF Transcript_2223/g.8174 Transcript_2223/m.8174 type:complete len:551 (-) Transcript_2223:93-1745(-)
MSSTTAESFHTVHKPKTTTLFDTSDASLLFQNEASPKESRTDAEKLHEQQEKEDRAVELKKMLFDDDDDLLLDEEEDESELEEAEYETLAKERNYGNYDTVLATSLEDEDNLDGFINNGDPDSPGQKNSSKSKKLGKKRKLKGDAMLNSLRRQNDVELHTAECLMMDEMHFLFKVVGLDALNPGVYVHTDVKLKTRPNASISTLSDSDDDFDLELVEVEDDGASDGDVQDDIVHEDLLGAPQGQVERQPLRSAVPPQLADDDDFDNFDDEMDGVNDENDPSLATSKNALFRQLVQSDQSKETASDNASHFSADTSSSAENTQKRKKRRGLDLGPFEQTEDFPYPLGDDESSMAEDEEPQTPSTTHILQKLRNLQGRGASVLAMTLTGSNKVSPLKEDDDFSPSPNNKRRKAQSAPEPECTFYAEDSSDEDEEERERRHYLEVRAKLREQRLRKEKNSSPLVIKSASASMQQTLSVDKISLARKRKRVAEEAFAKRKELASKFSRKYKRQKTSSVTANKISSVGGGFFSSFQKKETVAVHKTITKANKRQQ